MVPSCDVKMCPLSLDCISTGEDFSSLSHFNGDTTLDGEIGRRIRSRLDIRGRTRHDIRGRTRTKR